MIKIVNIALLLISMVGLSLFSQSIQFEEILPQAPMPVNLVEFDYVAQGASEFSDVDGDGDIDLIISGSTSYVGPLNTITRLYLNDGVGNFILDNSATFTGVRLGTVDFIDVDGDSDDDLLITGQKY
ncbi:MAG: VCBS repeat-containing protein [Crocinitomicaceae bacterium]|nr:VCBS repeat-containing protein [Crocinitomicaceae bacterium]